VPGDGAFTMPAHTVVGARDSWLGLFHAVGNVSEWTSSFLDPYPGAGPSHALTGRAQVVRGGSADDEDPYLMRPAFRGWPTPEPDDEDETPLPQRALSWTGLRLARYDEPVSSRLPSMHLLARAWGAIAPDLLRPVPFAGLEGLLADDLDPQRRDPLSVGPGVKSIVAQPFPSAAAWNAAERRFVPLPLPEDVERDGLMAASATAGLPLLLGLLHLDLPVLDLWAAPEAGFTAPQRLRRVDAPAGTWFVGLWNGVLVLVSTDLRTAYALSNRAAATSEVQVIEQGRGRGDTPYAGRSEVRLVGRRAEVEIRVRLSGSAGGEERVALVRLALELPPKFLTRVARWEPGSADTLDEWLSR
jgi:hypothetical protein